MKSIGSLVLGIVLALTAPIAAKRGAAIAGAIGNQAGRATELLNQARQALGGQKLDNVQSISMDCKLQRTMGENQVSGDSKLEFLLPDKFMQTENISLPFGDATLTRVTILNGDQLWEDQNTSGPGRVIVRAPSSDPHMKELRQIMLRNELSRNLLSLLLKTQSDFEMNYAGEAQADDGSADVIDVKGPQNFAARLFLDKKSHYPLMMSYKAVAPRMVTRTTMGPPNHEEAEKEAKEMERKAASDPKLSEYQVRFADFRAVDGVMLPHKITKAIDGQVNEELEVEKYKINLPMKPEHFEKKK